MTRILLVSALFLAAVHADEADSKAEQFAKEEARIKRRRELKSAFDSAEKLVAEKVEAFALQAIRNWESGLASLEREDERALADPLRYFLIDEDWEVSAFACWVAGERGMIAILPDIEKAYDDARYPIVRRKAIEAAASFAVSGEAEETRPFLRRGLEDDEPGVRLLAVEGLEHLQDRDGLRKASGDKDHDTRYRAQSALARLEDRPAQTALLKGFRSYIANKDLMRRASLETHDVGERYSQFLNALALGYWGGTEGVKLLATALRRDGDFRNKLFLSIGAAASLGKARPEAEAARGLRDQTLKGALSDGDAAVRGMAAFAVGFTGDAQFVRGLQRLLKDAQSDVRHNAVEALGRIPGKQSVDLLGTVLKLERDVPVRLAAVRGLARHAEPEAVDVLARALRDKRYMVRLAAARMLGRRGKDAAPAVRSLAKAARDPDYGVREAAVVALARVGAPGGLKAIVDALKDRDAGVRIRALRALARFPDDAALREAKGAAERCVALLVGAAKGPQRRAAHECLVRMRSPHAVPPLLDAIDSNNYSHRIAAFLVLRDYSGGKHLDYAAQKSGNERRKAVKRWEDWWEQGGPIVPPAPPPKKRANQDLPSFHRYTRDLRWRGIDLVLAYDSTGSMIPVIRAVKQRVDLLIEESARIVPNLRLSLFTYRDVGEEYVFYGTPLTYATENLKAFVQVAEANRGGDLPEAVTTTVKAAIERLDWRKDAQKVIVVIGDAPYHPENAGELFGLVRNFARKENRGVVHAIYTDPNRLGESVQARRKRTVNRVSFPFLDRLNEMAKVGGGKAITIADTQMLISEILVLSFGEKWRDDLESRIDFD